MPSLRVALASTVLLLALPAGAQAELVVPDSGARWVFALDGTVMYQRIFGNNTVSEVRPWMRVVNGRARRADGVPRGAYGNSIGRDHRGRVILLLARRHTRRATKWWIYDVERERARRLTSLPRRCGGPQAVSIWRGRVAYIVNCFRLKSPDTGVFLRHRGSTRRLTSRGTGGSTHIWPWERLYLRGGLLVADRQQEDGDLALWRLLDGGRRCRAAIPGSYLPEYGRSAIWVADRTVGWFVPGSELQPGRGLAGARLAGRCEPPGAPGGMPVAELPSRSFASHDGRALYYTERDGLHRLTPPDEPSSAPPANDDLADAAPLPSVPPFRAELTPGTATTEAGEVPGERVGPQSAWYVFRPVASQRVTIRSAMRMGVFTGSSMATLRSVNDSPTWAEVTFDAQAGQTYSIGAGCDPLLYCYVPQSFEVAPG